jgi:hypothetical protein
MASSLPGRQHITGISPLHCTAAAVPHPASARRQGCFVPLRRLPGVASKRYRAERGREMPSRCGDARNMPWNLRARASEFSSLMTARLAG